MKKHIVVVLAALLLTVLFVTQPMQAAPPFKSPLPPAITETSSIKTPFDLDFYVPCALGGQGEFVHLSGNLHILSHLTIDPNGGFHYDSMYQPQGVRGFGQTSGDKYQATGGTRDSGNFRGLPYNFTYVNNFRIIGQGPGNNYVVHENVHVTYNAKGEMTASVDNLSVDCK